MKQALCFLLAIILINSCDKQGQSIRNHYKHLKVLRYSYSFGERSGEPIVTEEAEYHPNGKLKVQIKDFSIIKFIYDPSWNLLEKTKYAAEDDWEYSQGQVIRKEVYTYDVLNRILSRKVYSETKELISLNEIEYIGDSITIERGFGEDLSDEYIYQGVGSPGNDPRKKFYSKNDYWIACLIENGNVVKRICTADFFSKKYGYKYDENNNMIEKLEFNGSPGDSEKILSLPSSAYKIVEMKEIKHDSRETILKQLQNFDITKMTTSEKYEYDKKNRMIKHKDYFGIGEDISIREVEYPDKTTEVWSFSGFMLGNGERIRKYDSDGNVTSILKKDETGEPQEYYEYLYSR